LIFSSSPPPTFFAVRVPENSMLTRSHEADEDYVQNCGSFAYDWIKVAATTNILQHESKDSCLFRFRLDGLSVLIMCKIKRIMHESE
jgi:hypothetical protein